MPGDLLATATIEDAKSIFHNEQFTAPVLRGLEPPAIDRETLSSPPDSVEEDMTEGPNPRKSTFSTG